MMQSNVTRMSHDIDPHGCGDVGMVESHHVISGEQSLGHVSSDDQMSCGLGSHEHSSDQAMVGDRSGDKDLHHVIPGDQELSHVTGEVMGVASSSAIVFQGERPRLQNETQGGHWNQELDTDMDQFPQQSGTVIHDDGNVQAPCNGSNNEKHYNQQDNSFNQLPRHIQAEGEVKSLVNDTSNAPEEEEVGQTSFASTPAQTTAKIAITLESPISQQGEVCPVVKPLLKQPTAINALKRCTCETYSSDDDDVFLPNPPSKSQADKCIVAMVTDDEVAPPTLANTASSVDDAAPGGSEVVSMETPGRKESGKDGDKSMEEVEVEKKGGWLCVCVWGGEEGVVWFSQAPM